MSELASSHVLGDSAISALARLLLDAIERDCAPDSPPKETTAPVARDGRRILSTPRDQLGGQLHDIACSRQCEAEEPLSIPIQSR